MRNAFASRVWIAAATIGMAATVSIIAAQAPQPPAGGRGAAPRRSHPRPDARGEG